MTTAPRRSRAQRAARGSLLALGVALAAGALTPEAANAQTLAPGAPADRSVAPPAALFAEVAAETGLDFVHFNGMTGRFYYAEVVGSGAALFDYDADGDLDLYLVQGALLAPEETLADALFPPAGAQSEGAPGEQPAPGDRLYRNDLEIQPDGRRRLRFTEVTEASGIEARGYGMGVAAGDFDNDGWVDLYVTNLGSNQLWRNRGDGSFEDLTAAAGVDDPRWNASAAFADFDADGWLDLYVTGYVDYSLAADKPCFDPNSARDYCGPVSFDPLPDRLFRNRGQGPDGRVTFEDWTARGGLATTYGAGLGVVSGDFDGDRRLDFFVTNDGMENHLWRNRGDGGFEELCLLAGCAVNLTGQTEAGMGVDAADFDLDGDEDLFLAHLAGETNTLYVNDGAGTLDDATLASGLALPSLPFTSFGAAWLDVDADGWLDLLVASGAVRRQAELVAAGDPFPLHQPNQLFRNLGADGGGRVRFADASGLGGEGTSRSEVSRGLAVGDLDNDGLPDAVVTNNNGPVRVLHNRGAAGHGWLGLRLTDPSGRHDLLGARVAVLLPGQPPRVRRARTDGSYLSARDPRVLVGLGPKPELPLVRVEWPDGALEEFDGLPLNAYSTLRRGSGRPAAELLAAVGGAAAAPASGAPAERAESSLPGAEAVADTAVGTAIAALDPGEVQGAVGVETKLEAVRRWLPPPAIAGDVRLGAVPAPVLEGLEPAVTEQILAAEAVVDGAALVEEAGEAQRPTPADSFGELGRLYQVYGFRGAALAAYAVAASLAPADSRWPYYRGHLELAAGDAEGAGRSFAAALAAAPGDPPSRLWLAQALMLLDRPAEARPLLEAVLTDDPSMAAAHALAGQIALAEGDAARAVGHFEAALASQPGAGQLAHPLANAYRRLGDRRRAAMAISRRGKGKVAFSDPLMRQLDDLNLSAKHLDDRGLAELVAGRPAAAAEAFRRAVSIRPSYLTARINLGTALVELGELDGAAEQYRAVLAADPGHAGAHFNLGTLAARRGDDPGAIEHYRAALAADPDDEDAHFNLANALARGGLTAEAVEHYARTAQLDPARVEAALGGARGLVSLGRDAEARDLLEAAHVSLPAHQAVAGALARLLASSPDPEVRDGAKAVRLAIAAFAAERTFEHAETLALAHAEAGDFAAAALWQRRALAVARRAGRADLVPALEARLAGFERGEPVHRRAASGDGRGGEGGG